MLDMTRDATTRQDQWEFDTACVRNVLGALLWIQTIFRVLKDKEKSVVSRGQELRPLKQAASGARRD